MQTTITQQVFTFHKTREAAAVLAKVNQDADPDCTYRVEESARGFFVALYDGADRIGTL